MLYSEKSQVEGGAGDTEIQTGGASQCGLWLGRVGEAAVERRRDADQSWREMQEEGFCPVTAGVSGKAERILFAINTAGERAARGHTQVVRISNCGRGMDRSCHARLWEGPSEVREHKSGRSAL